MSDVIYNIFKVLLVAYVAILPQGVARASEPRVEMRDAAGRNVVIADRSRVVAIGGAITEIVYALGMEDRLVAVDTTSVFPAAALKQKPDVGYMRAISPEGVLSLGPTLVLASEGAGPPDAIKVLEQASVPFVLVPNGQDAAGVLAKIRFVARAMGVEMKGEELAQAVAADFEALAALRSRIPTTRSAVFVMSMGSGSPMVAGHNTGADAIFALAGVANVMHELEGYKPAVGEAVLAAEPYAIVQMGNAGPSAADEAVFRSPAFAATPAARDHRLIKLDGQYLLGFGPRTPQAARDLAAALYPELDLPRLPARAWMQDGPQP